MSSPIHVVALLARAGHGKTTVANHLRDKYGARIVSLASPLKAIAKVVMDFDDRQLYGSQAEKEENDPRYGMSARVFLQKLGTEGIREHLGPDTFLDALVYRILQERLGQMSRPVYVVDDVRFPNEVRYLRELEREAEEPFRVTVMKILCTDAPPSGNDDHASERGIDEVPSDFIDTTITSSRKQGIGHLVAEVEGALGHNLRSALLGYYERAPGAGTRL